MIYTWIKSFVTTAEHMNFTKASTTMYMTQSALSKQIASLETYLGIRLFDRDRKSALNLTEEGAAFLPQARSLLEYTEKIISQTTRPRETESTSWRNDSDQRKRYEERTAAISISASS
jgi:DNA-binding transcriptional LysR family regulator